jgi:hypothetical protein
MNVTKCYFLYESRVDGGSLPAILGSKEDVFQFLKEYFNTAISLTITVDQDKDSDGKYIYYKVSGISPFGNSTISKTYYLIEKNMFTDY